MQTSFQHAFADTGSTFRWEEIALADLLPTPASLRVFQPHIDAAAVRARPGVRTRHGDIRAPLLGSSRASWIQFRILAADGTAIVEKDRDGAFAG